MEKIYNIKKTNIFSNLSLTTKLIILNILAFIILYPLTLSQGEEFLSKIALTPSLILSGKALWTFLTSMFMHGSLFHLFANMFSLFFIGKLLERIIGKKRFFWIYIIAGIIGGIFFVLASLIFGDINTPAVGASGALFGLLGVLAIIIPYSKVYLIIGPLLLIIIDAIQRLILSPTVSETISLFITFLIFLMIFSLFSFNSKLRKIALPLELSMWLLPIIAIVPLIIISYFIPLPIGNSAHIGGLIVGLIYGLYLKKKFPNKIKKISSMFR